MARVIQLGKRSWLAGMTWVSYEDAPNKEELMEDASRLGASWTSVRIGASAVQAGFSAPVADLKHPSKLFSLAAMLADSREQPWLGIFKIQEGVWWYIAVRDGHAILPDGDVVGGEAEIHAARDRHSGYTDWKYIEGDISLLDEFVKNISEKPTLVRSLTGESQRALPLLISAVVVAVLLGGSYWWWHEKQSALERERIEAMAKMRARLLANQPVVTLPSPLLTTPEANDWLAACGNAVDLPLSRYGWVHDGVSCGTSAAMVHWTRQDGATVANRPAGTLGDHGNSVDEAIQLTGLKRQGRDDAIDLPAAKLLLRAWAQAANFTLTLTEPKPAPVLPGATNVPSQNKPGEPVPRPQAIFALEIPVSPFGLDMSSIPGLRLTGLKSTVAGWRMEGVLYGR